MKKLTILIILLFAPLLVAQEVDWDAFRSDVADGLKLMSRMKHNALELQDEQLLAQQLSEYDHLFDVVEPDKPNVSADINYLVDNADIFFWSNPREKIIAALQNNDLERIQYYRVNYRTNVYSAKHDEVLPIFDKIIIGLGG